MGIIESALMSIGKDELMNRGQEFAGEHFQPTKDPYYEQTPDGKKHRRRMPDYCSKEESKNWKKIQNKAWMHDKGLCGCCCWTENIGWAPFLAIFPVIGPALMYSVHNKLIKLANKKYDLPPEMLVKMHTNIVIDLCISLIPILGSVFAWLHACSTRNAAMVYNFVCERALEKHNNAQRVQQARQDSVTNNIQSRNKNQRQNNNGRDNREKEDEVTERTKGIPRQPERARVSSQVNVQQREVSNNSNASRGQQSRIYPQQQQQRAPYPSDPYGNYTSNMVSHQPSVGYRPAPDNQNPPQYAQQYPQDQYIPMNNIQQPQRAYNGQNNRPR